MPIMAYFYELRNGHFKKVALNWGNAELHYFAKYDVFCGCIFLDTVNNIAKEIKRALEQHRQCP